ncbi:TPA: hypothetical protein ACJJQ5_000819, partial [Neisseria meningitidis]
RGYLGKIRRYLGRKQPKTCVWVSAVGRERNFAKVSIRTSQNGFIDTFLVMESTITKKKYTSLLFRQNI